MRSLKREKVKVVGENVRIESNKKKVKEEGREKEGRKLKGRVWRGKKWEGKKERRKWN